MQTLSPLSVTIIINIQTSSDIDILVVGRELIF